MKVIKNNYKINIFPLKAICEKCGSELELEESDCYIGPLGAYFYICPCCGEKVMLCDGITLTKDTLKFPTHYFYCDESAYKVTDEEINIRVKEMIEYLRESRTSFHYTSFGNTFIFVHRCPVDEEYYVVVNKNPYEAYVPFEYEDIDDE